MCNPTKIKMEEEDDGEGWRCRRRKWEPNEPVQNEMWIHLYKIHNSSVRHMTTWGLVLSRELNSTHQTQMFKGLNPSVLQEFSINKSFCKVQNFGGIYNDIWKKSTNTNLTQCFCRHDKLVHSFMILNYQSLVYCKQMDTDSPSC